jgi:short-subunit dehydrogenase
MQEDSRPAPLAVVTGASSGIGAALAERLADRGYRLLLIARRRLALEALARRYGPERCTIVPFDLTRCDQIAPAVRPLLAEHGAAEVLINCAGAGLYKTFLEHERDDFLRLMRVNFLAAVEMTRCVLPGMLQRGCGTVINIASVSSKMGPWGHAGYAASKAALVSLTQTLAAEHAGSGVHFCYVNPGIVETEYFTHEHTRELWPIVRRHALKVAPTADKIMTLLQRPRLELCIPRHYRCLDWIRAVSVDWAHRLVARGSRPARTRSVVDSHPALGAAGARPVVSDR